MTERKKFNQEAGSVDATLHKLPKSIRTKYKKNRAKFEAEMRSLEQWARQGHTSGGEEDG